MPGCVEHRVRDRRGRAHDPDLADSLRAHRIHVRVDLVDPRDVDARHVGIDRDVVAREIVVSGRRRTARPCGSPP
jgi:hypothetical protein